MFIKQEEDVSSKSITKPSMQLLFWNCSKTPNSLPVPMCFVLTVFNNLLTHQFSPSTTPPQSSAPVAMSEQEFQKKA
uniref:Uncharacterized protein n=1 Tax=Ditylenchus dipsaci TaxID=166011 RepID=A0A915EHG7_9BILA